MAEETIIFNPPELAPNRVAVGLDELGIYVDAEGADWGETAVAVQLADKQIGAVVTDRHLKPVDMSIPLHVREEPGVSLAEAAHRLQSVVGLAQSDEYDTTWVKRVFDDGFGAAGAVAYQIHTAALQGLEGWLLAHRRHANEVLLSCLRSPLCYATEEVESEVFSVEKARALEFEIPEVLGTGPGLFSLQITNKGSDPWRAVSVAMESRDHPQDETKDTTAALVYEAEDLTLSGGVEVKDREGASGGKVARADLTAGWITILSEQFTHVGLRELWLRVWAETAGEVELRAEYKPLGAMRWSETFVTAVPYASGDFSLLDLGQARAERASIGDQRWEVRILGRAPGGAATVDLDLLRVDPVEHNAVVRAPYVAPQADLQQTKSPGTVESVEGIGTISWSNPENAKASDDSRATAVLDSFEESEWLRWRNYGLALSEELEVLEVIFHVERSASRNNAAFDASARLFVGGEPVGPELKNLGAWPLDDAVVAYSVKAADFPLTPSIVNDEDFGFGLAVKTSDDLTARVDSGSMGIYYTEVEDPTRVCFAERSIDFRSEGVFRQHPEDDVWGELVNEGFNLQAPPSFLEGRALRGIIVPSAGDLEALADSGTHDLEAVGKHRPAYHFAREAAE